jgi:hypothetical protein
MADVKNTPHFRLNLLLVVVIRMIPLPNNGVNKIGKKRAKGEREEREEDECEKEREKKRGKGEEEREAHLYGISKRSRVLDAFAATGLDVDSPPPLLRRLTHTPLPHTRTLTSSISPLTPQMTRRMADPRRSGKGTTGQQREGRRGEGEGEAGKKHGDNGFCGDERGGGGEREKRKRKRKETGGRERRKRKRAISNSQTEKQKIPQAADVILQLILTKIRKEMFEDKMRIIY